MKTICDIKVQGDKIPYYLNPQIPSHFNPDVGHVTYMNFFRPLNFLNTTSYIQTKIGVDPFPKCKNVE